MKMEAMQSAIRSWMASMGLGPTQCRQRALSPVYGWGPDAAPYVDAAIAAVTATLAAEEAEAAKTRVVRTEAMMAADLRAASTPSRDWGGYGDSAGGHFD